MTVLRLFTSGRAAGYRALNPARFAHFRHIPCHLRGVNGFRLFVTSSLLLVALYFTYTTWAVSGVSDRFALWDALEARKETQAQPSSWFKRNATPALPGMTGLGRAGRGKKADTDRKHALVTTAKRKAPATTCLVTVWENGNLPNYIKAALDSFGAQVHLKHGRGKTKNGHAHESGSDLHDDEPTVEMYFFLAPHMGLRAIADLYGGQPTWPENVHAIDIGEVEPEWRAMGWNGFLGDSLCRLYGERRESWKCAELKEAIRLVHDGKGSNLVHLRGLYGNLFAPWVNSERCKSWAWGDLDTLWGDVAGLLDAPLIQDQTDVYTLSFGDLGSIYTRGQFTAFNHHNNPQVDSAWRICAEFMSMDTAISFFRKSGWHALDEGCTTTAVLHSGHRLTVLPMQTADWSVQLVRIDRGVLMGCEMRENNSTTRALCRDRMRSIRDALEDQQLHDTDVKDTHPTSPFHRFPTRTRNVSIIQPIEAAHPGSDTCMAWVDRNHQYCAHKGFPWEDAGMWVEQVEIDTRFPDFDPTEVHADPFAPVGNPNEEVVRLLRFPFRKPFGTGIFEERVNDAVGLAATAAAEDDPQLLPPSSTEDTPTVRIRYYESVMFHFQMWKKLSGFGMIYPDGCDAVALASGDYVLEMYENVETDAEDPFMSVGSGATLRAYHDERMGSKGMKT